jgi:endonuclease YncB( thermonuclease family)
MTEKTITPFQLNIHKGDRMPNKFFIPFLFLIAFVVISANPLGYSEEAVTAESVSFSKAQTAFPWQGKNLSLLGADQLAPFSTAIRNEMEFNSQIDDEMPEETAKINALKNQISSLRFDKKDAEPLADSISKQEKITTDAASSIDALEDTAQEIGASSEMEAADLAPVEESVAADPVPVQSELPQAAPIQTKEEEDMKAAPQVKETRPEVSEPAPIETKQTKDEILTPTTAPVPPSAPEENAPVFYKVWRVYNADILRLTNEQKVVLIGVDTPEPYINRKLFNEAKRTGQKMDQIKSAGKIALKFTKKMTEGKRIRLEFGEEPKDKYGRLQAYVFLENGTFVNAEIIRQGYGRAVERGGNAKYFELFKQLEKEARDNRRGFWANLK